MQVSLWHNLHVGWVQIHNSQEYLGTVMQFKNVLTLPRQSNSPATKSSFEDSLRNLDTDFPGKLEKFRTFSPQY